MRDDNPKRRGEPTILTVRRAEAIKWLGDRYLGRSDSTFGNRKRRRKPVCSEKVIAGAFGRS